MSHDNERFKEMVESSPDWFWEFDGNANFTYVSPRIKDLLGYDPEELIGLNAFDLMSADEAERVRRHFDPLAKKYLPFNNLENINIHKNGHEVVIESSGTPIFDEEGHFSGYRGIDRDITQRKKAAEELQASKARLQNILDTSSEWVWEIDLDGRHTYSNHVVIELLGYRPDEFIGKEYFAFLHEDDLQRVQERLPRLVAEKRGWNGWVLRWRHKDGSYRYLESNAKPIFNALNEVAGYSGSDRDVTERKQAEVKLVESEGRFRTIAEMLPVVVFELELNGNLRFANRRAFELFGFSEEEFAQGLNAFDMVVPEEKELAQKRLRQRLAGEAVGEVEYTALRKDRSTFPVSLNAIPIMKGSDLTGILGIMTDITERKKNETTLLEAKQAAEQANRAKSEFLANVSHEIRTPMIGIIGYSDLLASTELTEEQQQHLATICASGDSLMSLIDDILDLSKIEAGKLDVNLKDFSLRKCITELVATQQTAILNKGLSCETNIPDDLPDLLVGDPLRIKQILLNLLGNAIKFTETGAIRITASVAQRNAGKILLNIAVEDTGIGIPEASLKHIFEPFTQADGSTSRRFGGSGLGLSICQRLTDLMGGSLRVTSHEGGGSCFSLRLPLEVATISTATEQQPVQARHLWQGPDLKILLVEDNPTCIEYTTSALEMMVSAVVVAKNGKLALDYLQTNTVDLVLMDIQMPEMDGDEVLRILRKREQEDGSHLPVIALTAYALKGDKEKYLQMGFDGYLSKPATIKEMADEMQRVWADLMTPRIQPF
jgi:PAS domain S-box-containing protein